MIVAQQANFKTIGRVAVGGGMVAAGACALFAAAPAQAFWGHHNNTTNTTNTTTTTNPNFPGFGGNNNPFPNPKTCPGGNCIQPVVTSPFPIGNTVGLPGNTGGFPQIASTASGTSTSIQLFVPHWG
jgi:hypothetical protein